MNIVKKEDAIYAKKPEGLEVWYYLFNEYEVHLNIQPPATTQAWHYHEHINETIFIVEGELAARWVEGGEIQNAVLRAGDLVETERSDHTFENKSDSNVKFLVLKQILTGKNKREILKNDKVATSHDVL